MSLLSSWKRFQFRVGALSSNHPWLFYSLYRLRGDAPDLLVSPQTELVIEGFPRSGNTFATMAFGQAQQRSVRVAHHIHSVAQILRAVKLKIPTMVLIRPPEDATKSLVLREPHLGLEHALWAYHRFYQRLLSVDRESFVLAPFEAVVTDFGCVIEAVNRRFKTDFSPFDHTSDNVQRCFDQMERSQAELRGPEQTRELRIPRPSAMRQQFSEELNARLAEPALARWLRPAQQVYEEFKKDMVEVS